MDMKDGMIKLIQKFNEVRENMLGSDAIELTPKLNDANEYISKIAKLSNDYKLNCAWKCLADGVNVEKSINELYNYVNDNERAFFISNEFRKIILLSSVLSSSVIALIMGKIVKADKLAGCDIINILKLDKENIDSYKYTLRLCANGGIFLIENSLMEKTMGKNMKQYMKVHIT